MVGWGDFFSPGALPPLSRKDTSFSARFVVHPSVLTHFRSHATLLPVTRALLFSARRGLRLLLLAEAGPSACCRRWGLEGRLARRLLGGRSRMAALQFGAAGSGEEAAAAASTALPGGGGGGSSSSFGAADAFPKDFGYGADEDGEDEEDEEEVDAEHPRAQLGVGGAGGVGGGLGSGGVGGSCGLGSGGGGDSSKQPRILLMGLRRSGKSSIQKVRREGKPRRQPRPQPHAWARGVGRLWTLLGAW